LLSFKITWLLLGDDINLIEMPLINGYNANSLGTDIAIFSRSEFVNFSNIQIRGYSIGLIAQGNNLNFDNIVVSDVGDFRAGLSGFQDYNGVGMRIIGNNNSVKNSIVLNSGAEGLVLNNCDNCLVDYVEVASDNNVNATDYYLLLTGGTENTTVENSTVRRKTGLNHFGHGLVLKAGAYNNIVKNSNAINTTVELSFGNVSYNHITNINVTGTFSDNSDTAGSIEVANGAHHNTFSNISIDNVWGAIRFRDWEEGSDSNNLVNAGNNNYFNNIQVTNSRNAIHFDEFSRTTGVANDNVFENCTFKNISYLFMVNRNNSNNKLINCTIENTSNFWASSPSYGYSLNSNTVFENSNLINVGFSLP